MSIARNSFIHSFIPGDLDTDVMAGYISTHSPIIARLEGRITFVTDSDTTCGSSFLQGNLFFITTQLTVFLGMLFH